MGERSVDRVGEHGFDDRVSAVNDVRVSGGLGRVGEERVVPVFFVMTRENSAPTRWQARMRLLYAESPRTRIFPASIVTALLGRRGQSIRCGLPPGRAEVAPTATVVL